jgi:hypothetical protein
MLNIEILVIKIFAVDADGTSAVSGYDITALDHESLDDAMELGASVRLAIDAFSSDREEIFNRLRYRLAEQTYHNSSSILVPNLYVKIYLLRYFKVFSLKKKGKFG